LLDTLSRFTLGLVPLLLLSALLLLTFEGGSAFSQSSLVRVLIRTASGALCWRLLVLSRRLRRRSSGWLGRWGWLG
jgi:hypothetical protein